MTATAGDIGHTSEEQIKLPQSRPSGSGKTTFSNSIIAERAELAPEDRVVIIEDTPELQCSLPNHVQLLARLTFHKQSYESPVFV